MSSASFPSTELPLRPSRWLTGIVLALGSLALVSVALSALPHWMLALPLVLTVHALRHARRDPQLSARFGADGSVRLRAAADTDGEAATLLAMHERGPLLVLVLRRHDGRVLRHALAPDTIDDDARRQLRLWSHRHLTTRRTALPAGSL